MDLSPTVRIYHWYIIGTLYIICKSIIITIVATLINFGWFFQGISPQNMAGNMVQICTSIGSDPEDLLGGINRPVIPIIRPVLWLGPTKASEHPTERADIVVPGASAKNLVQSALQRNHMKNYERYLHNAFFLVFPGFKHLLTVLSILGLLYVIVQCAAPNVIFVGS